MKATNPYSLLAFLAACLFMAWAGFMGYPKWTQPKTEATLSWDVCGYYTYLPATFIYGDLQQVAFLEGIIEKYYPVPNTEQVIFSHDSGNKIMKYSMGQAVLLSPFFGVAHLYARNSAYPADGYSPPYQLGIQLGSLLVAFLGLFVMRRNLLRYFSDGVVASALLLLVVGTNYLEYAAITNAMTHNYLFTIYALLIAASIRFYEKKEWWVALSIGVLIGLAALTRPTEIIAALIPLSWGVHSLATIRPRLQLIGRHWPKYLMAGIVTIFIGSWQLIYWKSIGGDWVIYSYQDQGFSWDGRHLQNALFSFRAGWLTYTPIMWLAVLGFLPLWRKRFSAFGTVLLFFLIFTYIAFSWDIWWYGGSLGQRVMVQAYPVLLFPFAAALEWVSRRSFIWKAGLTIFLAGSIYLNLWLHYQAHGGGLLRVGNMTKAYFLRVVGRFEKNEEDQKLLDTPEDFRGDRKNVRLIYQNNFETDTTATGCPYPVIEGNQSIWVDAKRENSRIYQIPLNGYTKGSWVRTRATFYYVKKVEDSWWMPQFMVKMVANGDTVKHQYIKPYRMMEGGEIKTIYFDHSLPGENEVDRIDIGFWRGPGQEAMVIDELEVELFEPE